MRINHINGLSARTHIAPASVADRGAIVLGGGFRLPTVRDTRVADRGVIVLGGGFRLRG